MRNQKVFTSLLALTALVLSMMASGCSQDGASREPTPILTITSTSTSTSTPTPVPEETEKQGPCTLTGGEIVLEGWSGKDTGTNSCNQCMCIGAGLACTKMACPITPVSDPTPTLTVPPISSTPMPVFAWSRSKPEDQGMDPDKIQNVVDYVFDHRFNTQSLIIVRNGKIVVEKYQGLDPSTIEAFQSATGEDKRSSDEAVDFERAWGYRGETSLATTWSTAKSITSTLIGIAIDQGYIESVDEYVSTYISDWIGTKKENSVTIKDLLEMRSGLECPSGDYGGLIYLDEDQLAPSIDRDFDETRAPDGWVYCNADTMVLGEILRNATGQSIALFGEENLFSKIGMNVDWWRDADDNYLAYCCIDMVSRDFARFGLLWLNKGGWNGQQVIPSSWISESLMSAPLRGDKGTVGYGYQWWTSEGFFDEQGEFLAVDAYGTVGYHINNIWIVPSHNLVVVRNSLYRRVINDGWEAIRVGSLRPGSTSKVVNYHDTLPPRSINEEIPGGLNADKMMKEIVQSITKTCSSSKQEKSGGCGKIE